MELNSDRFSRWRQATSYAIYYGRDQWEQLSQYDVLVVEPLSQSPETVARLQRRGALVLAYFSVMETSCALPEGFRLATNDFLRYDNRPITNPEYGGHLMDLRSQRWQRLLMHRASTLLLQGYDGLFLDTIGDVEDPQFTAMQQTELADSAALLVSRLRQANPGRLLVQNNGLGLLARRTATLLDGICWENPPRALRQPSKIKGLLERMRHYGGGDQLRLLLLFEDTNSNDLRADQDSERELCQWATESGVLVYRAPRHYLKVAAPRPKATRVEEAVEMLPDWGPAPRGIFSRGRELFNRLVPDEGGET